MKISTFFAILIVVKEDQKGWVTWIICINMHQYFKFINLHRIECFAVQKKVDKTTTIMTQRENINI
jgi:hypothetical protein